MAEYVDKKDVIKTLFELYEQEFPTADGEFDFFFTKVLPQAIYNIPNSDVIPVRCGKWNVYEV